MNFAALALDELLRTAAFLVLFLVLFLFSKWFKDLISTYKLSTELIERNNQAIGLAMSGYYLATAFIFAGSVFGPTRGLMQDLLFVGFYSLLGIVMLNLSAWLTDMLMLRRFCDTAQLVQEKNVGVGAVHCGIYIATGLIAAGAVSGEGGGVVSAIVFFLLGQVSLLIFSMIYERFSCYDIHEELLKHNVAAGIAFGGSLVALAIIIMNANAGDAQFWSIDLIQFGWDNLAAFVFLPLMRLAVDRMIIPGHSLGRDIRDEANIGAGMLEGGCAVAFAIVLAFLL